MVCKSTKEGTQQLATMYKGSLLLMAPYLSLGLQGLTNCTLCSRTSPCYPSNRFTPLGLKDTRVSLSGLLGPIALVMRKYILSSSQVMPNSWWLIIGFLNLCLMHGLRPTMDLFRACFILKQHPHDKSWWYFFPQRGYQIV